MDDLNLEGGFITVSASARFRRRVGTISTTDETDALYAAMADVRVPETMSYVTQAERLLDGLDNWAVGAPEDILALMAFLGNTALWTRRSRTSRRGEPGV